MELEVWLDLSWWDGSGMKHWMKLEQETWKELERNCERTENDLEEETPKELIKVLIGNLNDSIPRVIAGFLHSHRFPINSVKS